MTSYQPHRSRSERRESAEDVYSGRKQRSFSSNQNGFSAYPELSKERSSANRERRRRRLQNKASAEKGMSSKKNKSKNKAAYDADFDPYDSDPGMSYREHCMKIKGISNMSCVKVPSFLSNRKSITGGDEVTAATSALSPIPGAGMSSATPASLPAKLARVQYSLRSSITDGGGAQPSGPSVMERRELRPNNVLLNVSHWSDSGGRAYMEDRYTIDNLDAVQVEVSPTSLLDSNAGLRRLTMPLTYFGVYDGHGGDKASQFCSDWLPSYVRNDGAYPHDLGYAMKNSFTKIDEDFVDTGESDGSTACAVTLVGNRRIICANAGDSRAIVVRKDGSIVRLSRDHKPGMADETKRISDLGGRVIYWGRWRVEGLLAVSRSIGDASLKPYITAEPEICEYDVGRDDWFLILSSDGVWDVMDNEEAAHVVIASSCAMENGVLKIDTERFKWAARNLCEHARSCGSSDNFSVVVADLRSCGNPTANSGRYTP